MPRQATPLSDTKIKSLKPRPARYDDLKRQTERLQGPDTRQIDMFADFNGLPSEDAKPSSGRMIVTRGSIQFI